TQTTKPPPLFSPPRDRGDVRGGFSDFGCVPCGKLSLFWILLRELCSRGHGDSALLIGCPELGLATIRRRGSIYCELSGVVNLARALEIKGLQLPRRQFFATHFYQQLRDQGALHHQAGELFDFSDIVPIIMDAMGVVPNSGKTE